MPPTRGLRLQRSVKYGFFAVDRFSGGIAVLVSDDGQTVEMPRAELPKGLHEGSVLRVGFGLASKPDWSSAVIDKEEEHRRRNEAKRILDEMKQSDPGGDITL